MTMQEATATRLRMLQNGYTPLPNVDKLCQMPGWPTLQVTPQEIEKWSRMTAFEATGVRLQDGLAALDFDVDHEDAPQLYEELLRAFPILEGALMRAGKGFKEAWFVRVDEPFGRIFTPTYEAGGEGLTVEVFGGESPRQFGAIGWHSKGELTYGWYEDEEGELRSPETVPLSELPLLQTRDVVAILRHCDDWMSARGWRRLSDEEDVRQTSASALYDLREDMVFETREDGALSLQELRIAAQGGGYYYCSASFCDGEIARNTRRCAVSMTENGVAIWDSMTDIVHHEESAQPESLDDLSARVAERMQRMGVQLPQTEPVVTDTAWRAAYVLNGNGAPRQNEANVVVWLQEEEGWSGAFGKSQFNGVVYVLRDMPGDERGLPLPRPLSDGDVMHVLHEMQHDPVFGGITSPKVHGGILIAAERLRVPGPAEYLLGLQWDGTRRLRGRLRDYVQTAPSQQDHYVEGVLRKWMLSAVARALHPGCKVDAVLVLQGEQGIGKSTFLSTLAGEWFGDDMPSITNKDAKLWIRDVWIAEIAELGAMRGKEAEHVKAYLTARHDKVRPPYGRTTEVVPRHTVFAGTTNASTYLTDYTGGRRFWPLEVTGFDLSALQRDRDQLWAEATSLLQAGEAWWVDEAAEPQLARALRDMQEEVYEADPDEGRVAAFLRSQVEEYTTVRDVFAAVFAGPEKERPTDQRLRHAIPEMLIRLGWRKGGTVRGVRRWVRGPDADAFAGPVGGLKGSNVSRIR